jgi:NAD(P)-dependent dehydrogenase (short-subunit alcohol dehydrogenase family)
VTDPDSVRAMFDATKERYGGIDVLYNNAGIMPADDSSILETEPEAWERVHQVNTRGVFLCCKYGIPHLLERGGGSVINVASFVAILGAATSQIAYTASKGAVLSMTRELAVEFARQGVRVNAICPGPVETPLLMRLFKEDPAAYQRRRGTFRWGAWGGRRRSPRVHSSSRVTTRHSSRVRRSSSTVASQPRM